MHVGHRVGRARIAVGFGHTDNIYGKRERMPTPALSVLDPASRVVDLAGRPAVVDEQHLPLEHWRPSRRPVHVHGLGARREQRRDCMQLAGMQRRVLPRHLVHAELRSTLERR